MEEVGNNRDGRKRKKLRRNKLKVGKKERIEDINRAEYIGKR